MATRIKQKRDSAAAWIQTNPALADGQLGIEKPSAPGQPFKLKIGDGVSTWNSLEYAIGLKGEDGLPGAKGDDGIGLPGIQGRPGEKGEQGPPGVSGGGTTITELAFGQVPTSSTPSGLIVRKNA